MIDFKALEVLVTEKEEDFYRRHNEIKKSYDQRWKYTMEDLVGFCIDRARDTYILGMPDVSSFLSGKSLEEALSMEYRNKNPRKEIPDFCCLIEWAKDSSVLDCEHAGIAHEVRRKRNDYGHAYLKVLRKNLKKSPNRRPFTDKESLDTYDKTVKVLAYLYKNMVTSSIKQ